MNVETMLRIHYESIFFFPYFFIVIRKQIPSVGFAGKLTNPALAAEMLSSDVPSTTTEVSPSHSRRLLEMTQKTTGKVISFIEGAVSKMQTTDGSDVSLGSLLQQVDERRLKPACTGCGRDVLVAGVSIALSRLRLWLFRV